MDLQPLLMHQSCLERHGDDMDMLLDDLDDLDFDDLLTEGDVSVAPPSRETSASPASSSDGSVGAASSPLSSSSSSLARGAMTASHLVFLPSLSAPLIAIKDLLFPSERVPPSPPPYAVSMGTEAHASAAPHALIVPAAPVSLLPMPLPLTDSADKLPFIPPAVAPHQLPLTFVPSSAPPPPILLPADTKKRRLDEGDAGDVPSYASSLASAPSAAAIDAAALGRDKESLPLQSLSSAASPEDMLRMLNQSFVRHASSNEPLKRGDPRRHQQRASPPAPPPPTSSTSASGGSDDPIDRRNRRRENHASVERRRRDHINDCIGDFVRMVPDLQTCAQLNKGIVLRKAVEHMRQLIQHAGMMEQQVAAATQQWAAASRRADAMAQQMSAASRRIAELTRQNEMLIQMTGANPAALAAAMGSGGIKEALAGEDVSLAFFNDDAHHEMWSAGGRSDAVPIHAE